MTELVQIGTIPPLHQSTVLVMSCEEFYAESIIRGRRQPGGMESARGNEIHRATSSYVSWCAHREKAMDPEAFDRFAKGAGPMAAKILAGMRDSYQVDYAHLLVTECKMALDRDLQPTNVSEEISGFCEDSGLPAEHEGTPDALFAFRADALMRCDDFKSHPKPFDPEENNNLQSRMYALMIFQHFPWVMTVVFRLIFVRYRNLVREVTYSREDIPALIDAVRSARVRQLAIHEKYAQMQKLEVTGGSHCCYCPHLAARTCPIAEFNPHMQFTPEERLRFALFYQEFAKANNAALKAYVQETGRVVKIKDGNGRTITFGPEPSESMIFPLFQMKGHGKARHVVTGPDGHPVMPVVEILMDHIHSEPTDQSFLGDLVISSSKLNQVRRTNKRVLLDQAFQDEMPKIPKAKLKASKPKETVEDDEDERAVDLDDRDEDDEDA